MRWCSPRLWLCNLLLLAACPAGSSGPVPPGQPQAARSESSTRDSDSAEPDTAGRLPYPRSPRGDTVESLHSEPVPDPYRWLEDARSQDVQSWTRAQDQLARAYLIDLTARAAIEDRLEELEYHDAISAPIRRRGRYFYTRRHADKEAEILYWKRGEDGKEIELFDGNEPDAGELTGFWPSPDGRKLAYALKTAKGITLHVVNVDESSGNSGEARKKRSRRADRIPGAALAEPSWTADSKGFYYTRLPTDRSIPSAELPGYAHVRYHLVGQKARDDVLVYPALKDPGKRVRAEVSADGRYLILTIWHGFTASDVYIKELKSRPARNKRKKRRRRSRDRDALNTSFGFTPVVTGIPAEFQVKAWNGSLYVRSNHQAPRYRLFKVDPRRLDMKKWRELVPESQSVLQDFHIAGDHLLLTYLRNVQGQLEVRTLDGDKPRSVILPGQGNVAQVIAQPDQGDAYFTYSSFTEPPQIFRLSMKTASTSPWAATTLPIDTAQMAVDQVWYSSRDGTKISMFLIRPATAKPEGKNPVLLHGEGAFGRVVSPWFSARIAVWVERGGIYAIPNLRGGGAYGAQWHKAGTRTDKQTTFDDFIHAAEYLIDAGWTTSERLAMTGDRHGGPLLGAAMTQAPGLFRAAVSSEPIMDMLRYHMSGTGATWVPEFGSAASAGEFSALLAYSPYHRIRRGTVYPAILVLGAEDDIDPMHARKFVAALQWAQKSSAPALLRMERIEKNAEPVRRQVERDAAALAFVTRHLAP